MTVFLLMFVSFMFAFLVNSQFIYLLPFSFFVLALREIESYYIDAEVIASVILIISLTGVVLGLEVRRWITEANQIEEENSPPQYKTEI